MAISILASNNAQAVLASGISSTATTLTVNTGTGSLFPSPVSGSSFFKLTLVDAATGTLTEIVHVTQRSGDTMTVVRAQEGTSPRIWSANDIAANMMTAGTLSYMLDNFQPTNANLTSLASLSGLADRMPYFTAAETMSLAVITSVGRSLVGQTSAANMLTYLGGLKATNNLSEIAAAGAAAQLAARTSLGLGTAATRLVGTGATQVPDMSSFASGDGWMKYPNGKILQYGYVPLGSTTHVDFPIPFPSKCSSIVCGGGHSNSSAVAVQNFYNVTTSGFDVKNQTVLNNATAFYWQAIGE